ncbi:hypothetical protein, partial [Eggerthella sinensis]|uniref:hypothetical protein n=1 Tax=Eggerthella sinensis TaxID=242230 RepID=UPI0022DEF15B
MNQKPNASVWLSRITAVVLAVLMTAFFVITINNMMTISNRTDEIKSSPYPVSWRPGAWKRCSCSAARSRAAAALPQRRGRRRPRALLRQRRRRHAREDGVHRERARRRPRRRAGARGGYADLDELQKQLVTLARDPSVTDEEIRAFTDERINPAIEDLLASTSD